ncbi:hypothetical protein I6I97_12460 [Sphingobacterium multivorum]|uniref:hypothetical protein n=1 Tax=Sphingobacterium multivorum TaxID=28454 RepID=UPI001917C497|nr:hypothetical protein [Sphingobacterium multivorum]QQT60078.1 hypothetical protein I6I97_12460 [Sphingobacterium multivorum]
MRKVIVVGAGLDLTGCQLIQFIEISISSHLEFTELIEAAREFKIKAQQYLPVSKELNSLIVKSNEILSIKPTEMPFKEKKPKYIRQQHKLAQRHYRRK